MEGDGILLKLGDIPLRIFGNVEVRVRRFERIEYGGSDQRYDTLITNDRRSGLDSYPKIPKGEEIIKRFSRGDKFLQVISGGKTVLVYGPLKKEALYFDKPRRK